MLRAAPLSLLLALAACGDAGQLKPAEGASLPVKPALAQQTPDADDLLSLPPYARPERVDELVSRSTPRQPDRFDLPPPEGGAAPQPDLIDGTAESETQVSDIPGPDPDPVDPNEP